MLLDRMIRAMRLDVNLYEEVEADLNATSQAATVVGIVAIASGIGSAVTAAEDVIPLLSQRARPDDARHGSPSAPPRARDR